MHQGRGSRVFAGWALGAAVIATGVWGGWRVTASTSEPSLPLVPVASAEDVLREIRAGKRVVFVDAREPAEFHEEHIPGAINITLREVSRLDRKLLGDPDLVIAYCLKDFRGFEVARALNSSGVRDARILAQFGIKGWKSQGLPTWQAGSPASAAVNALQACAREPARCLKTVSPAGGAQ